MKKVLYGTTALATAGLLAAGASDANAAAQRIQLEIHGYMQQWLVGVDQDFEDNPDIAFGDAGFRVNQGHSVVNVDQKTNAEVCFVGQTLLDNGITVGVNVQFEAENAQGPGIDEQFIFVQSDRFGQLKVGSEDGAASLLTVNAPDGGISVDDGGDVVTLAMFKPVSGVINQVAVSTETDIDSDNSKFTYITPRYFGFQAGASYTPIGNDSSSNPDHFGNFHSGYSVGLNYANVFANGFGIRASGGIVGFNQPTSRDPDGDDNDMFQWRAGAQVSYAGFTVGGGYKRTYGNTGAAVTATAAGGVAAPIGGTYSQLLNGQSWSIGGSYETGPYTVGVTYVQGSGVGWNIPGTGDFESKIGTVAGTYQLGPGIRLRGGFFWFDQEAEDVTQLTGTTAPVALDAAIAARNAGIQNNSDSDGWGGALAITASF